MTNSMRQLTACLALSALLAACGPEEAAVPNAASEAAALDAAIAELEAGVAAARAEVTRLRDVEDLENLAGAYGFYVDKSMQNDIADLFTDDGIVEILGRGVYYGQDRVREYMNNLGPVGPQPGALFNHMHLQPVIHIEPDGEHARVRSRLFVMYGIENTNAQWGAGVYENELVKEDGVWKFEYLHAYQTFYTNYEDGWAKRASAIFAPYDRLPPDGPQSVDYVPYPAAFVPPFHYPNPVSGRMDHFGQPRPPPAPQ
jgi:outer membrane murein-binding lipoprotein Lpp